MNILSKYIFTLLTLVPTITFGQGIKIDTLGFPVFIPYCKSEDNKLEKPIHLDWVQTDKEIITNKINTLPAVASTVTNIQKIIPNFLNGNCNCLTSTYDLGYGLKSTQHTINGGYGSCSIDAIYFNNQVIKLRIIIDNRKEIIDNYLEGIIQLPLTCINERLCYEKIYQANLNSYIASSGKLFLESSDANHRRKQAINYFTDALSGSTFAEPYYILFGLGSETFNNLRYFIINKDYDALENILYCPNPTGRLFAARTLLYMQSKYGYIPDNNITERLNDIVSNAHIIRSGILSCWINKFDYDYYDIVKDFDKLLTSQ